MSLPARSDICVEKNADCAEVGAWSVSIALGYGEHSNPLRNLDDVPVLVLPSISYYGKVFFYETDTLGLTFIDTEKHMANVIATVSYDQIFFNDWSIGNLSLGSSGGVGRVTGGDFASLDGNPSVSPEMEPEPEPQPTENTDSEALIDIGSRKMAAFAGLEYLFSRGPINFQIQALQDVSSVHDGMEIRTAMSFTQQQGSRQHYSVTVGGEWQDAAVLDYYFGIDASETRDAENEYDADAGFSSFLKFDWQYRLSKHWSLQANWKYRHLASSITASPLVEDDAVQTVFFGGVYAF